MGINWGWTMYHLSRQFKELADKKFKEMERVTVSGLSGIFWADSRDLTFSERSWQTSSSACAQFLFDSLAEEESNYVHRIRVPAFLSEDLLKTHLDSRHRDGATTADILRMFCYSDPGYRSVYGSKPVFPSTAEVETFVSDYLADTAVPGATVTVDPSSFANIGFGTPVTVTVSIPFNEVSWLPPPRFYQDIVLSGQSVMLAERPQ